MAETYDVYFGPSGNMTLRSSGQSGLTWTIPTDTLDYNTTYTWRIDATNDYGTTTGDQWSFTTLSFDPPLPTGVTLDGDGNPTGTPTGENNMTTIKKLVAAANSKFWYEDI